MSRKIKRMLASLTCTVMAASFVQSLPASAFNQESFLYSDEDYTVTYSLMNCWGNNYQGSIQIHNTGNETIHDWSLAYINDLNVNQTWNANVEIYNTVKFVRNAGYNQDILPGESVEFGFIGTADEVRIPDKFQLISEPTVIDPSDYSASFQVMNNWDTGFTATLTLTNESERTIEDWFVDFDWDADLETTWNAVLLEQTASHYKMGNASYNQNLQPGESVTICLQSNNGGSPVNQPTNICMQEYGLSRINAINDLLNVRDITIDTSALVDTIDNSFYVVDEIDSISGSIRPGLIATSGNYVIENAWGKVLTSGEFTPNAKWTIPNIGLVLGNNRVTVNTEFSDGSTATNSTWLFNLNENNVHNIDIDESDTDQDGLNNYYEDIYGTDPTLADTDGDGLNDYQELAETGTNPLVIDSNNDGVLDGRDDPDGDSINTITEYEIGTNPFCIDTDGDNLIDSEELNNYGTDPLVKDTDGDSAEDGWEVENGYDPLVPDDSFEASATVEGVGTTAEITVTAADGSVSTLSAEALQYTPYLNSTVPGYMGSGYEFEMDGEFSSAELKITFDESFLEDSELDPVIYYYNEGTYELEEVVTEWDGVSNYVTAELEHFSKYILLNRVKFEDVFKRDIEYPANADTRPFEFVFVIDSSGSMSKNDPSNIRIDVAKAFVDKMDNDDKAQVMAFDSDNYYYTEEFTSNKTTLKNAINQVRHDGDATYIGAAISGGLNLFSNYNNTRRYLILLTDGIIHDTLPTNYAQTAKNKHVQIITVGLGSGVDSTFLKNIANNTAPDNKEGLYYFASVASELTSTFNKMQKDVNEDDPYLDSNGDGITDVQTKAFCEGKLTTKSGVNPFAGYSYKEIQDDKSGDLDGDGLLNSEEVHLNKETVNSSEIYMTSDPCNADIDRDGFNDKQEIKHGTNPYMFDMDGNDITYLTNNQQFLASSYSNDYIHSDLLKAQLAAGNAIYRFTLSYTQDYEIALSNYFVTAAKTLSGYAAKDSLTTTTLDYLSSMIGDASKWLEDRFTVDGIINPVLAGKTAMTAEKQTQLYLTKWEWIYAVKDLYRDLANGTISLEELPTMFEAVNNKYDPMIKALAPKGPHDVLSVDFLKKDFEGMPVPANSSKFGRALKKGGDIAEKAGYVLIVADGIVDSYNAVASISAYASIDAQYDQSEAVLNAIRNYSQIEEMRDAATNLRKTLSGERSRYLEAVQPIMSSIAEGGKTYVINAIVNGGSKFAPWVFAVDAGLAVGDMWWNISDIDEASLATIALGDAVTCLSHAVNNEMVYYYSVNYCLMTQSNIDMINNLSQLRICSEDSFMVVMDNYPDLFDLIHKILSKEWLTDATAESCESNKNVIMMIMDQSPRLNATKDYTDY